MIASADISASEIGPALLEPWDLSKSFEGNRVLSNEASLSSLAKSTPSSARTAPASRRSSRSWAASTAREGHLLVGGAERRLRSPRDALANGIVVIHQELSLARSLNGGEYLSRAFPDGRLRSAPGRDAQADLSNPLRNQVSDHRGSGVTRENARDILGALDGAIVGSSLKRSGVWWNEVELARVQGLVDEVRALRGA